MSSQHHRHFYNDVPRTSLHLPAVTPPERLIALSFDNNGDIAMDTTDLRHLSPPSDSDNEGTDNPSLLLCPSPPDNPNEINLVDCDAPSPPPPSSPGGSEEESYDPQVFMSPLWQVGTIPEELPEEANPIHAVQHPLASLPLPPAPQSDSRIRSGPLLTQTTGSPRVAPSPPLSDSDLSFPSPSPPSSPGKNHPYPREGTEPFSPAGPAQPHHERDPATPGNRGPVDHLEDSPAISVSSASPASSFPWASIPKPLNRHFNLPYGESVIELARVPFQARGTCMGPCCQPRLVFATAFLDGEAAVTILRNMPTPGLPGIHRTLAAWSPGKQFNAVELQHNGGIWTFAPWAFTVWHRFSSMHDSIAVWGRAVVHLESCRDTESLNLMRSLRWEAPCPFPGVSLESIGRLGSKQWLNDEAISALVHMVTLDLSDPHSRILTSWASNFIRTAWDSFNQDGFRITRNWVSELYQELANGRVRALGVCFNVMAGGGAQEQGNHWIGVVIDTRTSTIHIGDSLDNPPDDGVVRMIKWFLNPVFPCEFAVCNLKCSLQPGNWSCGDYAINMIAHYFMPEKYPLAGSEVEDAITHRTKLFRAALKILVLN
jgi:hypothetical protein